MGSNTQQTRRRQLELFEARIAARRAVLAQRGIEGAAQGKDNVLRHLLAQRKRLQRALQSLSARVAIIEKARAHKQEKAAQAAEPKQKKKKAEAAPPEKEKKDKKAKKAEKAEKAQA